MPPSAESLVKGINACGLRFDIDQLAMPMRCINWYVAFAFCIWDGGRLPTEAEWTFAAANGDERRYFPWSENSEDERIGRDNACFKDDETEWDGPQEVGSHPSGAGAFGHEDMAGNVWEWLADIYRERLSGVDCSGDPGSLGEAECAGSRDSDSRVLKGGSFVNRSGHLANRNRSGSSPNMRDPTVGFRCVRDLR